MDTLIRTLWILLVMKLGTDGSGEQVSNPCASRPNGWQLLYWPGDGGCYRIFTKGHPCPPSLELTPGRNGSAECACPPGTALSPRDATCYSLYKPAPPCGDNHYFGPVKQTGRRPQGARWGACFEAEECEAGKVFWPKERRCYKLLSRGPCPEGLLLAAEGKLARCACDKEAMPDHFWEPGLSCHEHFTQGPCDSGQIFLHNASCLCNQTMKEYYPDNKKCYPIGSKGPCKEGHIFKLSSNRHHGECGCEPGAVLWELDGNCYHPFTRGPCKKGYILEVNYTKGEKSLACISQPCKLGLLYFPGGKGCHKPGTQGPCPPGQVVLHQPTSELSYLGVCGCESQDEEERSFYRELKSGGNCSASGETWEGKHFPGEDGCGPGQVGWGQSGACWPLYGRGPCNRGEWLVPDRGKGQREGRGWRLGKCECRPGYTASMNSNGGITCTFNAENLSKLLISKQLPIS